MPSSTTKPKKASGKQATRFPLSDEQRAHADSFFPAFEIEVLKHDPHHDGRSDPVHTWTEATAKDIMNHELFSNLPSTSGETLPAWIKTIKRRFSNHFVNNMAPKFFKQFYLQHKNCTSSANSSPLPDKATQNVLRSAMAIFQGDAVSPRELFADTPENKQLLEDKMREISGQFPNLVGGGLRNKALALLWDALEDSARKVWEGSATALLRDIELNRSHFPVLMANHLDLLSQRGCLGSVYMTFSYAFRDENDCIVAKTLYSGYNSEKQEALSSCPAGYKPHATSWLDIANVALPLQAALSDPIFSLNDAGIPLFPAVDVAKASLEQLARLLSDYLGAVWIASRNGNGSVKSLPWEDLTSRPDDFYNTKMFLIPVELQNPATCIDKPVYIYQLVDFFRQSAIPFQFHQGENNPQPPNSTANHDIGTNNTSPKSRDDVRQGKEPEVSVRFHTPGTSNPHRDPSAPPSEASSNLSELTPSPTPAPSKPPSTNSPTIPSQPSASNTSPTVGNTGDPSLPLPSETKKRGRPKSSKKAVHPETAIPIPAAPTRASTRKRKGSITNGAAHSNGPVNKKKRPGYFYENGHGGFVDEEGNSVDANGDRIPA